MPNFVQFGGMEEVKIRPRNRPCLTPRSRGFPREHPERDTERRGNFVPRAALNLPSEVSAGASGTHARGSSPPGFGSPPLPLSRARRFPRGEVQSERGRCTRPASHLAPVVFPEDTRSVAARDTLGACTSLASMSRPGVSDGERPECRGAGERWCGPGHVVGVPCDPMRVQLVSRKVPNRFSRAFACTPRTSSVTFWRIEETRRWPLDASPSVMVGIQRGLACRSGFFRYFF